MRTRKHILFYGITVVLLAILQAAFFDKLRLLGAKPDLSLVFVLLTATMLSKEEALGLGVLSGLFFDIVYGRYVGLYAFLYMLFAVAVSLFSTEPLRERKWWPFAVLTPSFFFYGMAESFLIRAITLYATKKGALYEYGFGLHLVTRILPKTLYNFIVLAVLYVPVLFILHKLEPRPLIRYD